MSRIKVGFTEQHAITLELLSHPAEGVEYSLLNSTARKQKIIRSPIKRYLRTYQTAEHDLVEAVLSQIFTNNINFNQKSI